MFDYIREDFARSVRGNSDGQENLRGYLAELAQPGTQAIIIYRIGSWLHHNLRIPVLRQIALFLHAFLQYYSRTVIGVNIARSAEIGPGFVIHTWTGINIGRLKAGRNLTLLHGVTIDYDCESVGDDVTVGAGAKVIRKVRIGDRVHIGANAVVMTDVPDDCIAVGVPARIIHPRQSDSDAAD